MHWTTRDGRVLKAEEFTDDHLRNAHRYVCRHLRDLEDMTTFKYHPVLGPRGDGAKDAFEQELTALEQKCKGYTSAQLIFKTELKKRNLDPLPIEPPVKIPEFEVVKNFDFGTIYKIKE